MAPTVDERDDRPIVRPRPGGEARRAACESLLLDFSVDSREWPLHQRVGRSQRARPRVAMIPPFCSGLVRYQSITDPSADAAGKAPFAPRLDCVCTAGACANCGAEGCTAARSRVLGPPRVRGRWALSAR